MKALYRLFCRHFARTCSPNVPSPFEAGTALVSSSICKMAAALQIPRVFHRGCCYESAKAVQSPHPGLKIKEKLDQSRAMPAYVPGVPPPPPG